MVPQVPVVVVSNRGPLSFVTDSAGRVSTKRAGGGLAASLAPAVAGTDTLWIAGAMTDGDRRAASDGEIDAEGFHLRLLDIDPTMYRMYYDVVSSGTLWYLLHNLWDTPRRPRFDRIWQQAWDAYRAVNAAFADATASAAPEGASVLVHDFHLALVGARLVGARPDLRVVWFSHTPFCEPMEMRMLPDEVAVELLSGLSGFGACGFHTERWATAFTRCCEDVLGTAPQTFISPAAADGDDVLKAAATDACAAELAELETAVGNRKLIVRVDRIELSKNLLRGFLAFDDLLEQHPEWRGEVVFRASVYPSREGLADYLAYRHEVLSVVERVNERWGTADWTPILIDGTDNFPRSIAALRRADVIIVNPTRDGLNLVAKEGVIVNERSAVLALSREAGAWEELKDAALAVNPFDVAGTSDVLHAALSMPAEERERRATTLRAIALSRTPSDWMGDQVKAAQSLRPPHP